MASDSVSDPLLTREQAAAYLGVSPATLGAWGLSGRYGLPFVKVGRCCRYRRSDLDAWVRRRTVVRTGDETRNARSA